MRWPPPAYTHVKTWLSRHQSCLLLLFTWIPLSTPNLLCTLLPGQHRGEIIDNLSTSLRPLLVAREPSQIDDTRAHSFTTQSSTCAPFLPFSFLPYRIIQQHFNLCYLAPLVSSCSLSLLSTESISPTSSCGYRRQLTSLSFMELQFDRTARRGSLCRSSETCFFIIDLAEMRPPTYATIVSQPLYFICLALVHLHLFVVFD